jgi:hypothetical protein
MLKLVLISGDIFHWNVPLLVYQWWLKKVQFEVKSNALLSVKQSRQIS